MKTSLSIALLLAACGPSPAPISKPAAVITPVAVSSIVTRKIDSAVVPATLQIDGRLDEWSFDAEHTILVAVAANRLVIATGLPSKDASFSIAIAAAAPSIPPIGWVSRTGQTIALDDERCEHEHTRGGEAALIPGKKLAPEAAAECRDLLKRRRSLAQGFEREFVRRFRISATSVEELEDDDSVHGVRDAVLSASGEAVEVSLPLQAFPRLSEAPLRELYVVVGEHATSPLTAPPHAPANTWTKLRLAEPISFEPNGDVRAAVFAHAAASDVLRGRTTLSYHPRFPHTVDVLHTPTNVPTAGPVAKPERPEVAREDHPLYEVLRTVGDVEVGYAEAHTKLLVAKKGGVVKTVERFHDVRGKRLVDGELHIFTYVPAHFDYRMGIPVHPTWRVVVIGRDGALRDVADPGVDLETTYAWDEEPKPFYDFSALRFGMRGYRKKRPKVVTWQWAAKIGKYRSSVFPADADGSLRDH